MTCIWRFQVELAGNFPFLADPKIMLCKRVTNQSFLFTSIALYPTIYSNYPHSMTKLAKWITSLNLTDMRNINQISVYFHLKVCCCETRKIIDED